MNGTNRLGKVVARINRLPQIARRRTLSLLMGRVVPYVGTSSLCIEQMTAEQVVASVPNRRRVQNHIRSVHAAAMALLAETASGFVVGMNVPDSKVPLLKSMRVGFKKRTKGTLRAVATLTQEQREKIQTAACGQVKVAVQVTDASGSEPISCQMVWAWVPKSL